MCGDLWVQGVKVLGCLVAGAGGAGLKKCLIKSKQWARGRLRRPRPAVTLYQAFLQAGASGAGN